MDPNATYNRIQEAVERVAVCVDASEPVDTYDIVDIVDYWRALDDWLKRGGFKPDAWK